MKILLLTAFFACNESKEDSGETTDDTAATEETGDTEEINEPEDTNPTEPVGDAVNGASVVESKCMGCHSGNPAIENTANMTDAQLVALFENGQGYMPAQNLSEQETLDVIAFLREQYGGS